jgi:hypothetical protein
MHHRSSYLSYLLVSACFFLSALAWLEHDRLIAKDLGEEDYHLLPRNYHGSYSVDDCLEAFGRHYGGVEQFAGGWFGRISRLLDRDMRPTGLVLKSIPFQQPTMKSRSMKSFFELIISSYTEHASDMSRCIFSDLM